MKNQHVGLHIKNGNPPIRMYQSSVSSVKLNGDKVDSELKIYNPVTDFYFRSIASDVGL